MIIKRIIPKKKKEIKKKKNMENIGQLVIKYSL